MLILNAILLNVLAGAALFTLARMYERRIFIPAESDALRLEEHEQFNRKIVASAPVGICILRTADGVNILSNELAHTYLNMLTHEDRQRLTQIICGQQVNFVDVLTSNNTNLQISFVHSRYRNENVAICVLVDVSSRVKMEESLQEMAQAAEQASQSKSMFLATVSHELRTPLYGIIGNLDQMCIRDSRWREPAKTAQQSNIPVTVERQLYRLIPGEEEMSFILQPVTSNEIDSDALYLDEITLTSEQDAVLRYGQVEVPLPPGADVERTTWGISVNKPNAAKQQGQLLEKARNEMGELAYMVPVKELTGTVTFRHLLRFSQKGQFVLPPARYVRSYAPAQQSVAAGSEWTGMQVK